MSAVTANHLLTINANCQFPEILPIHHSSTANMSSFDQLLPSSMADEVLRVEQRQGRVSSNQDAFYLGCVRLREQGVTFHSGENIAMSPPQKTQFSLPASAHQSALTSTRTSLQYHRLNDCSMDF